MSATSPRIASRAGRRDPKSRDGGFTLVEVIAVLVIVSIVLAVLLVRIPSLSEHTRRIEQDMLRSHIRYAQSRAMNTTHSWGVLFNNSTSYSLFELQEAGTVLHTFPGAEFVDGEHDYNPDNDELTVDMMALRVTSPDSVTFDTDGSPGAGDIPIADGADTVFTIEGNTGYLR